MAHTLTSQTLGRFYLYEVVTVSYIVMIIIRGSKALCGH
jgi:hypothetical protein